MSARKLPDVVSRDEWLTASKELLAQEKELTRARDRLNAAGCRWCRSTSPTSSQARTADTIPQLTQLHVRNTTPVGVSRAP